MLRKCESLAKSETFPYKVKFKSCLYHVKFAMTCFSAPFSSLKCPKRGTRSNER